MHVQSNVSQHVHVYSHACFFVCWLLVVIIYLIVSASSPLICSIIKKKLHMIKIPLRILLKTTCSSVFSTITYSKQLLDKVFVVSRIIKVEVSVISWSWRLRLITLTETLIISDITKTESKIKLFYYILFWRK